MSVLAPTRAPNSVRVRAPIRAPTRTPTRVCARARNPASSSRARAPASWAPLPLGVSPLLTPQVAPTEATGLEQPLKQQLQLNTLCVDRWRLEN